MYVISEKRSSLRGRVNYYQCRSGVKMSVLKMLIRPFSDLERAALLVICIEY